MAIGVAYWPLVQQGYPYTHSIGSNALWAYQFGQQVLAGQIYPRWLEQSFASLGSPTFVFYPPLCMWAIVPFAALNLSVMEQLIGSVGLALGFMAIGAWGVSRSLFPNQIWIQGICVAMSVLSPYFLINIHVRGAMGEMWAMVGLIWILWGLLIRWAGTQAWRLIPLSLAITVLALSHLPSLLLFVITWIPLPLILLELPGSNWRSNLFEVLIDLFKQLWCNIWDLYLPLGLGLGLACFFLLPPVFDQHLINIGFIEIAIPTERLLVDGILNFSHQLTDHEFDRQLVWIFGLNLGTGLVLLLIGWIRPGLQIWTKPTKVLFWATLLSVVMVTDLGKGLYQLITPLERIQFSWRWLAIGSICWPFLWGILLSRVPIFRTQILSWGIRIVGVGTTAALLFWGTGQVLQSAYPWPFKANQLDQFFRDRPVFPQEVDLTARPYETVDFALLRNRLGEPFMTDVSEYTPAWSLGPPHLPQRNYELIEWDQGSGEISDLEWQFGWRQFRVNALQPGRLLLRMYSWPGWQVRVGDQISEGMDHSRDGRLQITVPQGETQVEVRYRGSKAEQWGRWISGFTVVCFGVILRAHRRLVQILKVV